MPHGEEDETQRSVREYSREWMRVLVKGPFVSAPYDACEQRRGYETSILWYEKNNKRVWQ